MLLCVLFHFNDCSVDVFKLVSLRLKGHALLHGRHSGDARIPTSVYTYFFDLLGVRGETLVIIVTQFYESLFLLAG